MSTTSPRRRRVELVHESLLTHWPRLVRWRAEEIGGVQLRDELRQAAQMWEQHERSDDFLWTGTALREYQLWRERYPGGLTAVEEQFAAAMIARARRHQRRTRMTVAVTITLLLAVLASVVVLWRQSERASEQARAQARAAELERNRAEAAKLLALGELQIADYPTAALAYAIRSLEMADTPAGRVFAVRALAEGAPAIFTPPQRDARVIHTVSMSPGGEWVAGGGLREVFLFHRNGGKPRLIAEYESLRGSIVSRRGSVVQIRFVSDDLLVTNQQGDIRAFAIPSGEERWRRRGDDGPTLIHPGPEGFLTSTTIGNEVVLRSWSIPDGRDRLIGRIESHPSVDDEGRNLAYAARDGGLVVRSLLDWEQPPRVIPTTGGIDSIGWHPDGTRIAALHAGGDVSVWRVAPPQPVREAIYPGLGDGTHSVGFDPSGQWLMAAGQPEMTPTARLQDMTAPVGSEPRRLRGRHMVFLRGYTFSRRGNWLVTGNVGPVAFWPLPRSGPVVLRHHDAAVWSVSFTPDGRTLLSSSSDGTVRAFPLTGQEGEESRTLLRVTFDFWSRIEMDPGGERFAVPADDGLLLLVSLSSGEVTELRGDDSPETVLAATAFSDDGRYLASAPLNSAAGKKVIRIRDLARDTSRTIPIMAQPQDGTIGAVSDLEFLPDGRLIASIRPWPVGCLQLAVIDPETATTRLLPRKVSGWLRSFARDPRGSFLVHLGCTENERASERLSKDSWTGSLMVTDLATMKSRTIESHGNMIGTTAIDPGGTIVVTGSGDGTIRVGAVTGGEPHLLIGHRGSVNSVAVSPDGRWIASAGDDRTVRLWPMPDLTKTPLQTLPHDELMRTLESLTNLRVVDDEATSTGYSLEIGPFPGWEEEIQ